MIGILIVALVAAVVYVILASLTGNDVVAAIGALLVLISGIPTGGFGLGARFTRRGRV